MQKIISLIALSFITLSILFGQGYLHVDGKYIYDADGEEVILRGIGSGNWMIQEGYMMKSSDAGLGTQHEFRAKLLETIGEERTDSFYTAWLQYHMTKTDIDSMKVWGFNSLRVALHYIWFTPPIEDEPVSGEITWIEEGFKMLDNLLDWCTTNEMYLILDMHGTPGGQGKNADISDYDPSKPSLWESQDNRVKLIALWRKLAERYSEEPWIGGYDLINETNWDFENSGNENGCNCNQNKPLQTLFEDIIDAIREVDTNHIVFAGGNCWGNNYNGMDDLAAYDDNLVFSFHKYWSYNHSNSLDWISSKREILNVPVWLGESGENSNTWYTNAIALCENNRVGWSWWPVKKSSINSILSVEANPEYEDLLNYWQHGGTAPTEEEAFEAVLGWAEQHRIENCVIQYDVIDAMIRQPHTTDVKPYKSYKAGETVYATDYDLGRNGYAYFDTDTADYHSEGVDYISWNAGWAYRSDGVDIEDCSDAETNGYNIGWTADNEWTQYTVTSDSTAGYTLHIRHTSGGSGSKIHFEIDGVPASNTISLPGTGGWQNWETYELENFVFPEGTHKLKLYWEQGGSNLNYIKLRNAVELNTISFKSLYAETSTDGMIINLALNKSVSSGNTEIDATEFSVLSNGTSVSIDSIRINPDNNRLLTIYLSEQIFYGTTTTISYTGTSVTSSQTQLEDFSNLSVVNKLPVRHNIPGKIEAEDFNVNNGLVLETCEDAGGGQNTGYAAAGDFLDYLVYVTETGTFKFDFRVASDYNNSRLLIQHNESGDLVTVDTITFNNTGGWQSWNTQSTVASLPKGRYTLRLKVLNGEYNLNWFEISKYSSIGSVWQLPDVKIYPNPASDYMQIELSELPKQVVKLNLYNIYGTLVMNLPLDSGFLSIDTQKLNKGIYTLLLYAEGEVFYANKIAVL
ncbi:MAG: carbohydrate-binding protein [Bacteroidales bacterium]|nr:carbohydrate-binding protein [Bacteroidales bacterium]MBN2820947.1 carbohydrate-binding protein [Bacteroidales bacterium]